MVRPRAFRSHRLLFHSWYFKTSNWSSEYGLRVWNCGTRPPLNKHHWIRYLKVGRLVRCVSISGHVIVSGTIFICCCLFLVLYCACGNVGETRTLLLTRDVFWCLRVGLTWISLRKGKTTIWVIKKTDM